MNYLFLRFFDLTFLIVFDHPELQLSVSFEKKMIQKGQEEHGLMFDDGTGYQDLLSQMMMVIFPVIVARRTRRHLPHDAYHMLSGDSLTNIHTNGFMDVLLSLKRIRRQCLGIQVPTTVTVQSILGYYTVLPGKVR
jgi:hypothetical protein